MSVLWLVSRQPDERAWSARIRKRSKSAIRSNNLSLKRIKNVSLNMKSTIKTFASLMLAALIAVFTSLFAHAQSGPGPGAL
jgi:hypothetical protein